MNAEDCGYYSGCDAAHFKKVQNWNVSGNGHISAPVSVQYIDLRDITKLSYAVSDDNTLWYRNADRFIQIKPYEVKVLDVLKVCPE